MSARYVYTSSIMAYDQSWVGVFPWTEDQPTNPDGPASYGGFKALAEPAILARHAAHRVPGLGRPPGGDLRARQQHLRHGTADVPAAAPGATDPGSARGLVVGSYGHVDDLCAAMITMASAPDAAGEVFNVSGDSVDVNRYIAVLAEVVGAEPDVVLRARRAAARV